MKLIFTIIYIFICIISNGFFIYLAYMLFKQTDTLPFPNNIYSAIFAFLVLLFAAYISKHMILRYKKIIEALDGDLLQQHELLEENRKSQVRTGRINGIIMFIGFSVCGMVGLSNITKENWIQSLVGEAIMMGLALISLYWAIKSWKQKTNSKKTRSTDA